MIEGGKYKCSAYVRGRDTAPLNLIRRMEALLNTDEQMGLTVVGQSQEVSSGRTLHRVGLTEALRTIRLGHANAILVSDVLQLSDDKAVLLRILELMQDRYAVLICTNEDAYMHLHTMGLSQQLYQRSFALKLGVPWAITDNLPTH